MKTLKAFASRTAIVLAVMAIAAAVAGCFTGCARTKPTVYAGYYIENNPESKTTVLLGTNNSQANAVHAPIGKTQTGKDDQAAEASEAAMTAKSSGLFVNNNVGDRHADVSAESALGVLKEVRGSALGQEMAATRGDGSPATGGGQTQTPSQEENRNRDRTYNTPVAVSQTGALAQSNAAPAAQEQAAEKMYTLAIEQARYKIPAAQKAAVDAAVAADTDNAVPAGLDMTLAEWRTLKAAYIECPECLGGLTDAERAALKAATGK